MNRIASLLLLSLVACTNIGGAHTRKPGSDNPGHCIWFADADGDGWGDADRSVQPPCEADAPEGWVDKDGDCDDTNRRIHPNAIEECDGVDNDCDGTVDSGLCDAEEILWSDDFEDGAWGDWDVANLGGEGATWEMSDQIADSFVFWEHSNDGNSVAHGPDLGTYERWALSVDLDVIADNCNGAGIAFAWDSSQSFMMLRWQDPTGENGFFPNGGNIDIQRCTNDICETPAVIDGNRPLTTEWDVFHAITVRVDGRDILVVLDDQEILALNADAASFGPLKVGLWSDDCDNGVAFDNVLVTTW